MKYILLYTFVIVGMQGCQNVHDPQRFYDLTNEVSARYEEGKIDQVELIVSELNKMIPEFEHDWNYGNAIHLVHIVQGRMALDKGHFDEAKEFLLKAGKTAGSPQLNSFGPKMILAQELLLKNERDVVIEYLELCRRFWQNDRGKIDQWQKIIRSGGKPDFDLYLN